MRLSNVELIQSVIIDVDDPAKQGRIKCIVPGIFENSDDKECYPWINPLGMTRYQSFSKEMNGAKVWVIQVKDNYNEFYYIPLFDKIGITTEFLEEKYDENPEIVYMRDNCGQTAKITYDQIDGCMIQVNSAFVNIRPDSEIHCHTENCDIHMKKGSVFIGSDDGAEHEPAVLGNKLSDILLNLKNAMATLQSASSSGQFDNPALTAGFQQAVNALSSYNEIKCEKTKVN